MPERHERFKVAFPERSQNLSVVLNLLFVPFSFFRLNARPLNGEPMRVVAQGFRNIEVLSEAVVVIAGSPRNIIFFLQGIGVVFQNIIRNMCYNGKSSAAPIAAESFLNRASLIFDLTPRLCKLLLSCVKALFSFTALPPTTTTCGDNFLISGASFSAKNLMRLFLFPLLRIF